MEDSEGRGEIGVWQAAVNEREVPSESSRNRDWKPAADRGAGCL